jgi:hypothetical protein
MDATPATSRAIAGRVEFTAAVRELVALARRTLRCADADLSPLGLSGRATVEALRALLLSRRDARVRLLVDDDRWLERDAARLRQLQCQFPHALELRLAAPDDPVGSDSLLLADDRHLLLRRPGTVVNGRLALDDPAQAHPLVDAFERRWEVAGHNLPARPLGL